MLCAAFAFAACGTPASSDEDRDTTTAPRPSGEAEGDAGDADGGDEPSPAPTPAAIAERRVLDRLAAAFAPVSARVNFVVTAETLRVDAVDGNAGDDVERERAGVVRIEVERMRTVLGAARPKVAAVPVRSTAQQRVQQLLLEAIDARIRAMGELDAVLDAVSRDLGDTVVEERTDAWQASWQAAYRAARDATTITQARRAELGLEPAAEEALR